MASQASMKIIMGCMTFGGQVNEEDSSKMLSIFFDDNYVELDTAHVYQEGKTEEIMGRILTPVQRQKMYIATKANPFVEGGLTPESVRKQVETSLARLKLDHVDLLYLHAPDHKNPILETLRTCNELHKEGKFKELGLSNYTAWQVADIWHICNSNGWVKPTVYQGMYNVLTRSIEKELFPALSNFGLRFYCYNPIAGGLLAGKYELQTLPAEGRFSASRVGEMYKNRYWKPSYFSAMEYISSAINNYNKTNNQNWTLINVAFSWLLHHSKLNSTRGDAIIIGASKIDHMVANLNYCKAIPMPEELLKSCEEAWNMCSGDCPNYFR